MIGETLGPYRIIEQIGAGGMATVYKAYDAAFDRYVALKLLPAQYYHDEQFRQRFAREAKAIARLEHLHILPVYATGEDRGHMYIAMRLMPWGTLSHRIRALRVLPMQEAARLTSQLGSALDYAHTHGVLHRDVKPGNVLLDESRNAYLTDFGIAKVVEAMALTAPGSVVGTPDYMAPEQCMGRDDIGPAADQYALGIILYQMLTGQLPFAAETPMAVVLRQMHDPLPMPRQFRPEITESMQRVLLKVLSKDPTLRFEHCTALAEALDEAITNPDHFIGLAAPEPAYTTEEEDAGTLEIETVAEAVPVAEPTQVAARRRGWGWMALPLGLIGVALIAGLILTRGGGLKPSPTIAPTQPAIAAVPDETATSAPTATLDLIALASPAGTAAATLIPSPTPPGGFEWIVYAVNDFSSLRAIRPDGSGDRLLLELDRLGSGWRSPDGRYMAVTHRGPAAGESPVIVTLIDLVDGDQYSHEIEEDGPLPSWSQDGSVFLFNCPQADTPRWCCVETASGLLYDAGVWLSDDEHYLSVLLRDSTADSSSARLLLIDMWTGKRTEYPVGMDVPEMWWLPGIDTAVFPCMIDGEESYCAVPMATGIMRSAVSGCVVGQADLPCATLEPAPVDQLNPGGYRKYWSPDGSLLAYVVDWESASAGEKEPTGVYLINRDGSGLRLLAAFAADYRIQSLEWSHDGRYLAFTGDHNDFIPLMNIVDVQTGENWPVGEVRWCCTWSWSPTDARIVLMMPVNGAADIFTLTPGGEPINLTNHIAPDRFPVWSPDGQMIAFTSARENENALYLMNLDGSGLRRLPPYHLLTMYWAPRTGGF